MSKLYYSEKGHVVATLCEELTTYRRARKALTLPDTAHDGQLFVLVRPYEQDTLPLLISVNGKPLPPVSPEPKIFFRWYDITVPHAFLKPGENVIELWTDATAMNAWALAIEPGSRSGGSTLSTDGGKTWRDHQMGYLNVLQGEYVIRMRLAERDDPAPPAMTFEDASSPRLESLRRLISSEILQKRSTLERVKALSTWVCEAWVHTGTALGSTQNTPWDPETILAWGKTLRGHNGRKPIVHCVHYGVVFVMCAQAAGVAARCNCVEGNLDNLGGHFIAEVWLEDYRKWAMVDANLDAMFWDGNVPMSILDIQQHNAPLNPLVKWGSGTQCRLKEWKLCDDFERQNPFHLYLDGTTFRHRSVWPRSDFLSRPELTPPGHGTLSFCETELVWHKRDFADAFKMFPYFADSDYFDAPPQFS